MPSSIKSGLITKQKLTEEELLAIQQLVEVCNAHEGLHMRVPYALFETQSGPEFDNFLFYRDDQLVGCLILGSWEMEKKEQVLGAVHPDYRRQGIFRTLFETASRECVDLGVKWLVLESERASSAGKATALALGARYDSSEHVMELGEFQERYTFDPGLYFQEADAGDVEALVAIQSKSFAMPEERARRSVTYFLRNPRSRFYLATFGERRLGCREPVGMLRVNETDEAVGIYVFAILPDYRGHGFGRQMLEETIRTIRARTQKPIRLDVDVNNAAALALYRSCGLQVIATCDYYIADLRS
ncbi:MAG: GNAT family N-acetyltransferase [Ktedonobacteraceae bacterium]|nr:GNAT family N-acetyltransferase [Ktedonobacteraceae bacterium]